MNVLDTKVVQTPSKKKNRFISYAAIVLAAGALVGCGRPSDTDINNLLSEAYTCPGIEVSDMAKTDSLPGIYTYVGQYVFDARLAGGEEHALAYYKHLLRLAKVKNNKWREALYAEKLQDYFIDECTEAGQTVAENMFDDVLSQLEANKKEIKLPLVIPMSGWAEFMPGNGGWDMTIRRDKFGSNMAYSAPVKRSELLKK